MPPFFLWLFFLGGSLGRCATGSVSTLGLASGGSWYDSDSGKSA